MTLHRFSFDLETYLIGHARQAPKAVCLQFSPDPVEPDPPEIIHARDPAFRAWIEWALSGNVISDGSNVAYDWGVCASEFPDLIPAIFDAYSNDLVECSQAIEKLGDIADGRHDRLTNQKNYSLGRCAKRHLGIELNKDDPWRLRYGTLYDTPINQWPNDAISYALGDATSEAGVIRAQLAKWSHCLADRHNQTRNSFWLNLMTAWGIRCDPVQAARFHKETLIDLTEAREICQKFGLVRPGPKGSRDTKKAMRLMLDVCLAEGMDPTLTPAGKRDIADGQTAYQFFDEIITTKAGKQKKRESGIKLDADTIKEVIPEEEGTHLLTAYSKVVSATTILGRAETAIKGSKVPLHARFDVLKETGRTGCSKGTYGAQLQNMPRAVGLRECFVPRAGYVFGISDYDSFELCSWGQVCIWICGFSKMAEALNAGIDPHTKLGGSLAHISYEEAIKLRFDESSDFSDTFRQTGKIGNFGYPGGMGPKTLVKQARAQYGVRMNEDESKILRQAWRAEWPENKPYFSHIRKITKGGLGSVRHFVSDRVRGLIPYTKASNTYFQGLAADAAKAAGWQLAREMYDPRLKSPLYGSRIVNFIHDEYIIEIPNHSREWAHLACERLGQVMREVAQRYMPDVTIRSEPLLATRWSKKAKRVIGSDGLVEPWVWKDAA